MSQVTFVLVLFAGFQIKHLFCDGPLQTLAMVQAKSHYGRPLGIAHAAIHGAGTFLVFLIAGSGLALILAIVDFVIHYHIDFTKENIVKHFGWTPKDGPFWWALMADQALHHLTSIALIWLSLRPA